MAENSLEKDIMLSLTDVKKDYVAGDTVVHALKGITLDFERRGLVCVLGQSGCGKTTLMNIIGGLDRMTSGKIVIDGISTENYLEKDWNNYRNHFIGFVFQSYNLIPHMSVLANVEMALTLSGVSRTERREIATNMLKRVGLEAEIHKRPNQLSGGQCQRVAIARALASNPEIILADEPTGAIDSETSIVIMDLLKEISKSKLVIMVTHNSELATKYADRIITMKDGLVTGDAAASGGAAASGSGVGKETPVETAEVGLQDESKIQKGLKTQRAHMSAGAAIKQSFLNLVHKKGRTILTVIAGSIGIICIFLILAMNTGFSKYIETYESESLSKYPVESRSSSNDLLEMIKSSIDGEKLRADNVDLTATMELFAEDTEFREKFTDEQIVYLKKSILNVVDDMESAQYKLKIDNDISKFSEYLDAHYNAEWGTIRKDYGLNLFIYDKTEENGYQQINPLSDILMKGVGDMMGGIEEDTKTQIKAMVDTLSGWSMMVDDVGVLSSQYDVLVGEWPDYTTEYGRNGLVVVVDEYNQIYDYTLLFLNKIDVIDLFIAFIQGSTEEMKMEYSFDDFMNSQYALMVPTDYYEYNIGTGLFEYDDSQARVEAKSIPLHVSAIVRLKEGCTAGCIGGTIGYTQALAEYVINATNASALVQAQKAQYTNYLALLAEAQRIAAKMEEEHLQVSELPLEEQMALAMAASAKLTNLTTGEEMTTSDYSQWLKDMQVMDLKRPRAFYFYPSSIENKNKIVGLIEEFNSYVKSTPELYESPVDYTVTYTDELSEISSSMKQMINTITYVLIAVAVLAVVVAMILVAIILYISVQDRTKEIGVLRALGAGKGNIAGLFIAETFLIGIASGVFGVLIGLILQFPANAIIYATLGIKNLLTPSWWQSLLLVVFSFATTIVSGLIPSAVAAKKDPVVALRTE
ncbi:MAG: ATP-binding cassette domain-containing protein [Clostridia bacterium]|nr:ATP-binding cassette domain-containing protein [Clostridia bacterium]